jgi:hypothetical protein
MKSPEKRSNVRLKNFGYSDEELTGQWSFGSDIFAQKLPVVFKSEFSFRSKLIYFRPPEGIKVGVAYAYV